MTSPRAPLRGRLAPASAAPRDGERIDTVLRSGTETGTETGTKAGTGAGVTIEHILSGRLNEPVAYRSERHEWVVVLEGSADLEVAGEVHTLGTGDWVVLGAGTPHRLLRTEPGTRWLAVHFGAT